MSDAQHKPGVYVKGDVEKVANTPTRAVELIFEGYRLKESVPAESATYRDLQAQAKEFGIPANQSEPVLREAIAAAKLPSPTVVVDESDES